jgi:cytochrome P450
VPEAVFRGEVDRMVRDVRETYEPLPGTDRALLPGAIEETLRFYPPYPASRRRVAAYTELGGQVVKAGSWVVGWLTSANRDPDLFPARIGSTFGAGQTSI